MRTPSLTAPAWFESWFDTPHYHRLYANHDRTEATTFVDRLVAWLEPAPEARMLDLGRGAGRHARALATHGFDVTGLALAGETIRRPRRHGTPHVRFVDQDMREPFGRARFDFVFSFVTSFGYFADGGEDDRVVLSIADALRTDGTLVLDYLNVAWSERRLVPAERKEIDGYRYDIARWSDEANFFKRIETKETGSGHRQLHEERVATFRIDEFQRDLGRRGLD